MAHIISYGPLHKENCWWQNGMDHRRQSPWAHPQQNDTETWPLNQPTGKHKQTSFELSLHQGHGWWKPCFSDQIIFKLILAKTLCWNQPPGEPGRKQAPHAQPSSIIEDCNYSHCSQNWDIDKTSILAQGTLGLFMTFLYFFGSLCALCVLLVAGYTGNISLRFRNLARKLLKVKPHFWLLDTGTSASFIIHGAQRTSAMSHLPNAKIGFTAACSHKYSPDEYTALVVLSICSKKTIL